MKHAFLFIHNLRQVGGGLMVGIWAAQALARDYKVTILSWQPEELSRLDALYGTRLADSPNIDIVCAPGWLTRVLAPARGHLSLLRSMVLMRFGRGLVARLKPALVVSTAGETDLGQPLVQYIHYPWMAWPRPEVDLRWYHWIPAVLFYRWLAAVIGGYSKERVRRNVSLVNSEWTCGLFEKWYEVPATVLYPPVIVEQTAKLPWTDRDNAVVCIGRFSPEKRLLEAIAIVQKLRAAGYDLSLQLCGLPGDDDYLRQVRVAAERAGTWVNLHVELPRQQLFEIAGRCRYGLHAMIDEHFGIVVAEMLQLGCLPFVHCSGGPREIVAEERLTWNDAAEAAARISACIDDPALCADLREHAEMRGEYFSAEMFMRELMDHCARLT